MKALVGAFNQEKALVGAFSVIVQPVVEPMDRFTALSRTEGFMELEEQRQTVARLEAEEREAASRGAGFTRAGELGGARKKLMMMEKHRMMSSQMMMTHAQQQMFPPPPVRVSTNVSQHEVSSLHWNDVNITPPSPGPGLRGDCLVPLVGAVQRLLRPGTPTQVSSVTRVT